MSDLTEMAGVTVSGAVWSDQDVGNLERELEELVAGVRGGWSRVGC